MRSEVQRVQITPTMADKWLDTIPTFQRKIDDKQVNKLVRAIQKEQWRENGATIIFNEDGALIDGQHRLKAISLAGKSVGSLVVRGVSNDESIFRTIGDEKPRKLQDFVKGKNVNVVSSVLRLYWMLTVGLPAGKGQGGTTVPPIAEVMKLADKWALQISEMVSAIDPAGKFLGATSWCVFLCFYYTRLRPVENPERVAEFFARVYDGLNLTATDPVYKLRKRFLNISGAEQINRTVKNALILKALNMYLDGKPCENLKWDMAREEFPQLKGYRK